MVSFSEIGPPVAVETRRCAFEYIVSVVNMCSVQDRVLAFLNLDLIHAHFKRIMALPAVCLNVLYALELFAVAVFTFVPVTVFFNST